MSRDTNFYYSFLVLPPRKRRAILAVWDFCRAVDDAVDEAPSEGGWTGEIQARAASELAGWRSELAAVYGGTPRTRQGIALQPYAREFDLPHARFDGLIDGVEMALHHRNPSSALSSASAIQYAGPKRPVAMPIVVPTTIVAAVAAAPSVTSQGSRRYEIQTCKLSSATRCGTIA